MQSTNTNTVHKKRGCPKEDVYNPRLSVNQRVQRKSEKSQKENFSVYAFTWPKLECEIHLSATERNLYSAQLCFPLIQNDSDRQKIKQTEVLRTVLV